MNNKDEKLKEIYVLVDELNVSAYQISKNTGISQPGVGKIINKESKNPQFATVDKIHKYLKSLVNKESLVNNDNSTKEVVISKDDTVDVLQNKNGNTYYVKEDGGIEIEVINLSFPAYASYLEIFTDENQVAEEFNKTKFSVDRIGKGYYMSFDIKGDSMNGGGIDDTPDGAKVLAREIGKHLWQTFRTEKYGYILMTKDNIYHKDIIDFNKNTGELTLHSRNLNCEDFTININNVYRIFNVIKRTF